MQDVFLNQKQDPKYQTLPYNGKFCRQKSINEAGHSLSEKDASPSPSSQQLSSFQIGSQILPSSSSSASPATTTLSTATTNAANDSTSTPITSSNMIIIRSAALSNASVPPVSSSCLSPTSYHDVKGVVSSNGQHPQQPVVASSSASLPDKKKTSIITITSSNNNGKVQDNEGWKFKNHAKNNDDDVLDAKAIEEDVVDRCPLIPADFGTQVTGLTSSSECIDWQKVRRRPVIVDDDDMERALSEPLSSMTSSNVLSTLGSSSSSALANNKENSTIEQDSKLPHKLSAPPKAEVVTSSSSLSSNSLITSSSQGGGEGRISPQVHHADHLSHHHHLHQVQQQQETHLPSHCLHRPPLSPRLLHRGSHSAASGTKGSPSPADLSKRKQADENGNQSPLTKDAEGVTGRNNNNTNYTNNRLGVNGFSNNIANNTTHNNNDSDNNNDHNNLVKGNNRSQTGLDSSPSIQGDSLSHQHHQQQSPPSSIVSSLSSTSSSTTSSPSTSSLSKVDVPSSATGEETVKKLTTLTGESKNIIIQDKEESTTVINPTKGNLKNSSSNGYAGLTNGVDKVCNGSASGDGGESSSTGPNHKSITRRVSFDPLALLLDAALEGELELVKKTALQVSTEPEKRERTGDYNHRYLLLTPELTTFV